MTGSASGLPATTPEGKARARIMEGGNTREFTPTSLVSYLSRGRLLLAGPRDHTLPAARKLAGELVCVLLEPSEEPVQLVLQDGFRIIRGGRPRLTGALGRYRLELSQPEDDIPLDDALLEHDLVLDLGDRGLVEAEIPPVGYYRPRSPEALERDLRLLPTMTGEFDKPKYFDYDSSRCAHGRNGMTGCDRCIRACPASAITSAGDTVSVDPYLCQGGGSCVAACPTGAMTYAFPRASELQALLKDQLNAFEEAGGCGAVLLFHDAWTRKAVYALLGGSGSERVVPFELEEIGAIGMETWLGCLAYGAAGVFMTTTGGTPVSIRREIDEQIAFTAPILQALGLPETAVVNLDLDLNPADRLRESALPAAPDYRAARFLPVEDKRMALRSALNHLHAKSGVTRRAVELPPGAPFGRVRVDTDACTLCLACVSSCPTGALHDGGEMPQLRFVEWDCVQCGLCARACPEKAIDLQARLVFDSDVRQRVQVLHEEPPLCCVVCGRAFATHSMLKAVTEKLQGHWMFQSPQARRRLMMCEHCRVRDLVSAGEAGGKETADIAKN